jgi:hypothetical protein
MGKKFIPCPKPSTDFGPNQPSIEEVLAFSMDKAAGTSNEPLTPCSLEIKIVCVELCFYFFIYLRDVSRFELTLVYPSHFRNMLAKQIRP